LPEAEKLARQTIDTERRVMGPAHSDTLATMSMFAAILVREHEYSQAESTYQQLLELRTKALGPDHPETLDAAADLALLRVREHHYSEGETVLREQVAKRIKLFTPHNLRTAAVEYDLACALALEGKRDEAFSHLETFLDDGPEPEVVKQMISDPDLVSLHDDPRFNTLIAKGKVYIAALQNNK
jgi:tetratricopeptide (TPR) repeat protein